MLQADSAGSYAASASVVSRTRKTRAERKEAQERKSNNYYRTIGSNNGCEEFIVGGMAMVKEVEGAREQNSIDMPAEGQAVND